MHILCAPKVHNSILHNGVVSTILFCTMELGFYFAFWNCEVWALVQFIYIYIYRCITCSGAALGSSGQLWTALGSSGQQLGLSASRARFPGSGRPLPSPCPDSLRSLISDTCGPWRLQGQISGIWATPPQSLPRLAQIVDFGILFLRLSDVAVLR